MMALAGVELETLVSESDALTTRLDVLNVHESNSSEYSLTICKTWNKKQVLKLFRANFSLNANTKGTNKLR